MSSLSIAPPGPISDHQFVGDLMTLFLRSKVKCGYPRGLERFASELVSNAALRSDLFALCTAISHMAAEDLSGEELLVLVARALGGPEVAKGAAAGEIPAAMRSAFLEGYEAWSNRAAVIERPLPWTPARQSSPGDEPPAAAKRGSEPTAAEGLAVGERTIQMALTIVMEGSANGVIGFPRSGSGPKIECDPGAPPMQLEPRLGRGGAGISVSTSAILALFVVATGLAGVDVHHSLYPAVLPPAIPYASAERKPLAEPIAKPIAELIAKPIAGLSYGSATSQVAHAGAAASPGVPGRPRDGATQAASSKAATSIPEQPAIVLSAPGDQEALVDSDSEPDATAGASDAAVTHEDATAEIHRVSPVHVPSTTMDELALSEPRPVYPADQPKGISGTVMLEVSISKWGDVINARAVSGPVELRGAAEQAIADWRFRPYLVDGDPTEVTTTVGFFFNGR